MSKHFRCEARNVALCGDGKFLRAITQPQIVLKLMRRKTAVAQKFVINILRK